MKAAITAIHIHIMVTSDVTTWYIYISLLQSKCTEKWISHQILICQKALLCLWSVAMYYIWCINIQGTFDGSCSNGKLMHRCTCNYAGKMCMFTIQVNWLWYTEVHFLHNTTNVNVIVKANIKSSNMYFRQPTNERMCQSPTPTPIQIDKPKQLVIVLSIIQFR